ncbi:MAG: response regulator [Myxococcota bacterium]
MAGNTATLPAEPLKFERVLLLEDNVPLRRAMVKLVERWGAEALEAGTSAEALALLHHHPDLIVADICLPDGSSIDVLKATLDMSPEPLKIGISGAASMDEAFALPGLGVQEFLSKPFKLEELEQVVMRAATSAPEISHHARAAVGKVPMKEFQNRVRNNMIDQALAMTQGSKSGAARLLDISRQAVQQIARDWPPKPGSDPGPRRRENS